MKRLLENICLIMIYNVIYGQRLNKMSYIIDTDIQNDN